MNNLEVEKLLVKCDNKGCDWKSTINSSKEFRFFVNKRCPRCAGPVVLLTYRDLFIWYFMLIVLWILNLLPVKESGEFGKIKMQVKDGLVTLKPEKSEEEDLKCRADTH